jgi:hypothetical protein
LYSPRFPKAKAKEANYLEQRNGASFCHWSIPERLVLGGGICDRRRRVAMMARIQMAKALTRRNPEKVLTAISTIGGQVCPDGRSESRWRMPLSTLVAKSTGTNPRTYF